MEPHYASDAEFAGKLALFLFLQESVSKAALRLIIIEKLRG